MSPLQRLPSPASAASTASVNPPLSAQQGVECPICKDDQSLLFEGSSDMTKTPCGHIFHTSCLTSHLASKGWCPTCKKELFAAPNSEADASPRCEVCGVEESEDELLPTCSHDSCEYRICLGCNEKHIPDAALNDNSSTAPQFWCPDHANRCVPGDFKLGPCRVSRDVEAGINVRADTQPAARAARLQARTVSRLRLTIDRTRPFSHHQCALLTLLLFGRHRPPQAPFPLRRRIG